MPVDRPILMSGPLVVKTLADEKTQTRRGIRGLPPKQDGLQFVYDHKEDVWLCYDPSGFVREVRCPWGRAGDRLWVRETWAWDGAASRLAQYRANWRCERDFPGVRCEHGPDRWRPSIHMPRWASRLTLEVVSVRVERLQDITEEDARAEGMGLETVGDSPRAQEEWCRWSKRLDPNARVASARGAFAMIWVRLNGPGSWDANPWVWRIEFRRLEQKARAA